MKNSLQLYTAPPPLPENLLHSLRSSYYYIPGSALIVNVSNSAAAVCQPTREKERLYTPAVPYELSFG
jgi:hypothetical protein